MISFKDQAGILNFYKVFQLSSYSYSYKLELYALEFITLEFTTLERTTLKLTVLKLTALKLNSPFQCNSRRATNNTVLRVRVEVAGG